MKKVVKYLIIIFLGLILIALGGIAGLYLKLKSPAFNINENKIVFVENRNDYPGILSQLQSIGNLKDKVFFNFVAEQLKYPKYIKTGRYEITPKMSYLDAVQMLRRGSQTPVKLTFNNIRLKKDLAERIAQQLNFEADTLLYYLNDEASVSALGFDTTTIVAMFIPNTYEIYWTISAPQFLEKMKKEYERFWTPERMKKAEKIRLNQIQISALASIVEEETNLKKEYPIIAGLYLNRLKKGMLLQACPTAKYAVGDFTLKRILYEHLRTDSPYNTYKYAGLPPGPIRIPSTPVIDGVLNAAQHDYLYMCAKEDFSGSHYFSVTLSEHNRYAQLYQTALNQR